MSGDSRVVYGGRVRGSDGAVLGTPQFISRTPMGPLPLPEWFPSVAFDGENYFVAWTGSFLENGSVFSGIHGIRVRPSDGLPIESTSALLYRGPITAPYVAYGGGRYLVVWNYGQISGVRVQAASGSLLDATPITFAQSPPGTAKPKVASSGDQFLVVWNGDGGRILGNRMSVSDRAVLDGAGFTVAEGNLGLPSVTFDGQDYRVAWQGPVAGVQKALSTRVSPGGQPATQIPLATVTLPSPTSTITISPFPISAVEPGRFLVAYNSYDSVTRTYGRIFVRLVQDVPEQVPCGVGAPTLSLTGGTVLTVECGSGPYSDPGAQAKDGCGSPLQVHTYNSGSDPYGPGPNTSAEGSYQVQYSAWDPMGQTVNALRTVHVEDRVAPALKLKGAATKFMIRVHDRLQRRIPVAGARPRGAHGLCNESLAGARIPGCHDGLHRAPRREGSHARPGGSQPDTAGPAPG